MLQLAHLNLLATAQIVGEKIKGNLFCNACVLSVKPDGTDLKLVAWGIRDPEGLTFDKDGKLMVTNQGDDERGSRPIANDHDRIYKIDTSNATNIGKFYGWPDYAFAGNINNNNNSSEMPVTDSVFHSERSNKSLDLLIENPPSIEKKVFVDAGLGSIVTQASTSKGNNTVNSTNNKFGFDGKVFFAERGSFAPITKSSSNKGPMESVFENNTTIIGQVKPGTNNTIGQKIVMLDTKTGKNENFVSLYKPDSSFRPIGITFNNNGDSMYIASIGKQEVRSTLPNGTPLPIPQTWVYQNTGTIWKVSKNDSALTTSSSTQFTPIQKQNITLSPKDFKDTYKFWPAAY